MPIGVIVFYREILIKFVFHVDSASKCEQFCTK